MGLEFSEKLDLLGGGAAEEVSCQTCAVNPNASVVTHRANQPIRASDLTPLPYPDDALPNDIRVGLRHPSPTRRGEQNPRDLKPWLASAIRSDGKRISLVKTLMVQSRHTARAGRLDLGNLTRL